MCEGQTTHNWPLIELELLVNVNEGQHWLSYHLFLDIDIEKFLMIILFLQNGIEALPNVYSNCSCNKRERPCLMLSVWSIMVWILLG